MAGHQIRELEEGISTDEVDGERQGWRMYPSFSK